MDSYMFLVCAFLALRATVYGTITINDLKIPHSIQYGSVNDVILDCDYDAQETGIVIKWFFNGERDQIYQWISGTKHPGQSLGPFKDHIEAFAATNNSATMYRAIRITDITLQMSGNYTCKISGDSSEKTATKEMIIFEPAYDNQLNLEVFNDDGSAICTANGVYPQPEMSLDLNFINDTFDNSSFRSVYAIEMDKMTGTYNVSATLHFDMENLTQPAEFVCKLTIPGTDYSLLETQAIYLETGTEITVDFTTEIYATIPISTSKTIDAKKDLTENIAGFEVSDIKSDKNLKLLNYTIYSPDGSNDTIDAAIIHNVDNAKSVTLLNDTIDSRHDKHNRNNIRELIMKLGTGDSNFMVLNHTTKTKEGTDTINEISREVVNHDEVNVISNGSRTSKNLDAGEKSALLENILTFTNVVLVNDTYISKNNDSTDVFQGTIIENGEDDKFLAVVNASSNIPHKFKSEHAINDSVEKEQQSYNSVTLFNDTNTSLNGTVNEVIQGAILENDYSFFVNDEPHDSEENETQVIYETIVKDKFITFNDTVYSQNNKIVNDSKDYVMEIREEYDIGLVVENDTVHVVEFNDEIEGLLIEFGENGTEVNTFRTMETFVDDEENSGSKINTNQIFLVTLGTLVTSFIFKY